MERRAGWQSRMIVGYEETHRSTPKEYTQKYEGKRQSQFNSNMGKDGFLVKPIKLKWKVLEHEMYQK